MGKRGKPKVSSAHLPAHSYPLYSQEKVSQLKEEVRLQYEKLHQLLDEDLRQTVEVLDKAQAKFCSENAAQALHLGERMQEAKKLLGSLQLLFDKTEDVSFMKVSWAQDQAVGTQRAISKLRSAVSPTCSSHALAFGASVHGFKSTCLLFLAL